eukprot:1712854-Pyramimonas_sp.AAC.1
MSLQVFMFISGNGPSRDNRPIVPKHKSRDFSAADQRDGCTLSTSRRAEAPFLGLQHREPTILLRPDNRRSCQNTVPGTSTPWTNGPAAL